MGQVNFCNGSQWGTICSDGWDHFDAAVVCRELGYTADGKSPFYLPVFTFKIKFNTNSLINYYYYHSLQVLNHIIITTLMKMMLL